MEDPKDREQELREQVERLIAEPKKLSGEWALGTGIFAMAVADPDNIPEELKSTIGCLTMVRGGGEEVWVAATPELTAAIKADERIPTTIQLTSPSMTSDRPRLRVGLEAMLEWRLKLDALPRTTS